MMIYQVIQRYVSYDSASPYDYSADTIATVNSKDLAEKVMAEYQYYNPEETCEYSYKHSYYIAELKVTTSLIEALDE